MSGEYAIAQAIYLRLAYDSTLLGLAEGGVHFGSIEDMHEVKKWELVGGVPTITSTTLSDPVWVEYNISGGGQVYDATGDNYNDVFVRVEGISASEPGEAIDADTRIDALLVDWIPTHADIASAFKTDRIFDTRIGEIFSLPTQIRIYRASGLYRFRYCLA